MSSFRLIGARFGLIAAFGSTPVPAQAPASTATPRTWIEAYREPADRIIGEALSDNFAWRRLAEMTDMFGHRLSGSAALEHAIRWAADTMIEDGLENVRLEPVMVPHWVRGRESAEIIQPVRDTITMLGLGGSVGTGPKGIEAPALVLRSLSDLDGQAQAARGKIVVLNVQYTSYAETMQYRSSAPSRAARLGAVAVLVRSIAPPGYRTAHTGSTAYTDDAPRIPAAAISSEDADRLQRMRDRGLPITIRLYMEAKTLPDALSANVIAELRGSEKPDEVVVVAAHIDSWDLGAGATDDAGGCVVVWEAARLLQKLTLRPRRTIRVVLFTNEENGLRGALAYRDRHRIELDDHVLMLESDTGVFSPVGFGFTGSTGARARLNEIVELLRRIRAGRIGAIGGGADIGPSVQAANIPSMSLEVEDSKYFLVHHTAADTVDKIDPAEIARCAAAVAVMAYVVADMPERLDRH